MERELLDLRTLKTVEDIDNTDFSKFADERFKSWVRHIVYPVAQDDLNRVCNLSMEEGCKIGLSWSMGDLYYRDRALPQIKVPKQASLGL